MRKKRRLKKGFRHILFIIFFVSISIFLLIYFDLWNKIKEYIDEYGISINNVYVFKPKVKIIDENSNSRPIAVSINNNHDAYPHAGLQEAYLCYELIAEGGITRILAFYKDKNIEKIGSVRSTRHYFLDYIMENDAIFVHYGQSPQALNDLEEYNIDNINGMKDVKAFYRDKNANKIYEHTAFTKMSLINNEISNKKYRTTSEEMLLKYSPIKVDYESDESVIAASSVSIEYSNYTTTKYVYDSENMVYKLYIDGKEHIDAVSKEQYTVKNIITYQVKNTSIDTKGRQNLENIGSGEGYYITNGKAIKIKWEKKSRESKTKYTDINGNELIMNDGNTWIHIQPTSKKLKIE